MSIGNHVTLKTDGIDGQLWDVVVVGAGPAGAFSALQAARKGLSVLLVDKSEFPRDKVCGCCLNGRAVQILSEAGIWNDLLQAGAQAVSALQVRLREQQLHVRLPRTFAISRNVMDHCIIEHAVKAGSRFVSGTNATVLPGEPLELRTFRSVQVGHQRVRAKVVLVCDGLGHPSVDPRCGLTTSINVGSRIGLGAVVHSSDRPSELRMIVGEHGYVGIAPLERDLISIASAVDPDWLKTQSSPNAALTSLLQGAGEEVPDGFRNAVFRGTRPLSQKTQQLHLTRLLVLGDAAGYVEPFTGEGIVWALLSARYSTPIVEEICRSGWTTDSGTQWEETYATEIAARVWICRMLAAGLRRPWLLQPMMSLCQWFPSVTNRLVNTMNSQPSRRDAA